MKILIFVTLFALTKAFPHVGLVGPSGVIGPSGLVGPSGPVQFHQPAFAFLGHNAHAHVAAINRAKSPSARPVQFQQAPAVSGPIGFEPSTGCVVGPSGKVCPSGNVQYV